MNVTVAKNAGFCFGVKRATDELEDALENKRVGEQIFTLGTLIHNDTYNQSLYQKGVRVTDILHISEIAKSACEEHPVVVFIRAHGIPKADEELLISLSKENKYFRYVDCTCPFVKKNTQDSK